MKQKDKSWHHAVLLIIMIGISTILGCTKEEYHPSYLDKEIDVSINDIKGFYHGNDIALTKVQGFNQITISGLVSSDLTGGNTPVKNGILIQNGTSGIAIKLKNEPAAQIKIGDSIQVKIDSGIITSINGNIVIEGISASDINILSEKTSLNPKSIAISNLISNLSQYDESLVTLTGAKVSPHNEGDIYSGNKYLDDGSGGVIQLHTEPSATFANDTIPLYGTFTGIVWYDSAQNDSSTIQLWMRSLSDEEVFTPSPYPIGFPEKFNTTLVKDHYASEDLTLNSGLWTLDGVTLVTITKSRPIDPDGTKGVQFNQKNTSSEYLQMDFDVFKGASKVTVLYGSYGSDPGCTWRLEYSTDGGGTWVQTGQDIVANNKTAKTATFLMNIKGAVRFRIDKLGLGTDDNGRLNVDDFAIYNNQ